MRSEYHYHNLNFFMSFRNRVMAQVLRWEL